MHRRLNRDHRLLPLNVHLHPPFARHRRSTSSCLEVASIFIAVYHLFNEGFLCFKSLRGWFGIEPFNNQSFPNNVSSVTKLKTLEQIILSHSCETAYQLIYCCMGFFLAAGIIKKSSEMCFQWTLWAGTLNVVYTLRSYNFNFYMLCWGLLKTIGELAVVGGLVTEMRWKEEQFPRRRDNNERRVGAAIDIEQPHQEEIQPQPLAPPLQNQQVPPPLPLPHPPPLPPIVLPPSRRSQDISILDSIVDTQPPFWSHREHQRRRSNRHRNHRQRNHTEPELSEIMRQVNIGNDMVNRFFPPTHNLQIFPHGFFSSSTSSSNE